MLYYFATLKLPKLVLWCYLIWYLMTVFFHFDASPKLWLNSLGISAVIGTGLLLSVARPGFSADFWQVARLYIMPFCVSSFSALIKSQGFVLIFSPSSREVLLTLLACIGFIGAVTLLRHLLANKNVLNPPSISGPSSHGQ